MSMARVALLYRFSLHAILLPAEHLQGAAATQDKAQAIDRERAEGAGMRGLEQAVGRAGGGVRASSQEGTRLRLAASQSQP